MAESYESFAHAGLALDPIHIGTGGTRLGRVDMTIVRDPVTQIPKVPGSSLAGVHRAYAAMALEESHPGRQIDGRPKPYYPDCAGQGQARADGTGSHCGKATCPICTVFGFATNAEGAGGFAGLAAFSDAQVLLFPVATRQGPYWVTSPMALQAAGIPVTGVAGDAVYLASPPQQPLNLGWLLLPVRALAGADALQAKLRGLHVPEHIRQHVAVTPDKLFGHVVNSNLEVRTSVSIDPRTGAAEDGALFSYEALPRGTVLFWEVTCKKPAHFRVSGQQVSLGDGREATPIGVHSVTELAHGYLEHLGIGGMGTRGMGRLHVLTSPEPTAGAGRPQAQRAGR